MSQRTFDITYARASIRSLSLDYTLGTQDKPFGGVIINNNSTTGFASLDSGNSIQRILFMTSGNLVYLSNPRADGIVGIASNGGYARWFFSGSNGNNLLSEIVGNSTTNVIRTNTSDGSDASILHLCGGGDAASSRGSFITLAGNESSGNLSLYSGNNPGCDILLIAASSTSEIRLYTNSTERWSIDSGGALVGHSDETVIRTNTTDGSDTSVLYLCGGGSNSSGRGASIRLHGNESTDLGKLYLYSGSDPSSSVIIDSPHAAGRLRFSTNSIQRAEINAGGQFLASGGSNTAPGISFLNDPNTGFYNFGSDDIYLGIGGSSKLQFTATEVRNRAGTYNIGSATYPFTDGYFSNSLIFTDSPFIVKPNTIDGSDTGQLFLSGGGSATSSVSIERGAFCELLGNEAGGGKAGSAILRTGNVASSKVQIIGSNSSSIIELHTASTLRWTIDQFGQLISPTNSIRFTGDNQTVAYPVADGVSAAGSIQADAYAIDKTHTRISSASAGSGVILPDIWGGGHVTIYNNTAVTVKVYPVIGGRINALATNVSLDLAGGEMAYFVRLGTRWFGFTIAV